MDQLFPCGFPDGGNGEGQNEMGVPLCGRVFSETVCMFYGAIPGQLLTATPAAGRIIKIDRFMAGGTNIPSLRIIRADKQRNAGSNASPQQLEFGGGKLHVKNDALSWGAFSSRPAYPAFLLPRSILPTAIWPLCFPGIPLICQRSCSASVNRAAAGGDELMLSANYPVNCLGTSKRRPHAIPFSGNALEIDVVGTERSVRPGVAGKVARNS